MSPVQLLLLAGVLTVLAILLVVIVNWGVGGYRMDYRDRTDVWER